ncbi:MAG: TIGR01212 family radical SAM protein [Lachnospiraceae bacterium]|nr:TIGR01212 family radical SAM protein [Lachnospiraceae bacterium]
MFWGEKRYHSLDYHLKKIYGFKVQKISLDAGMTCPTRDGTKGTRGCIFCSAKGSGDFTTGRCGSITGQIDEAILNMSPNKKCGGKYIAYFQSFTNTYAPTEYLRELFYEAVSHEKIAGISIATRPDCLSPETMVLLCELQKIKPVWVELGLQTIHENTAKFIRRGYTLDVFDQAVAELSEKSIDIIVHVILGLPHETRDDMLGTIDYIAKSSVSGIKLQLLHVLKNTDLADYYGTFHILSEDEYTELVVDCLERLPEDMVIHRLTGDGPSNLLIAPLWSLKKRSVLNSINRKLKEKNTWQGRLYSPAIRDTL